MRIEEPGFLVACLDANVLISAIAFGGSPQLLTDRMLAGDFLHVTGPNILDEVRKNAINKLKLSASEVDAFLDNIREASTVYVPTTKKTKHIAHIKDSQVLEVALSGGCNVLITGDKKHLLPLSPFKGMIVEPPSMFLRRLDQWLAIPNEASGRKQLKVIK